MAIDLQKYIDDAEENGVTSEKIREIIEIVPRALAEGADPHDTVVLLYYVTEYLYQVDDPKMYEELLKLCHQHELLIRTDEDRATCDYSLLTIYSVLNFAPKIVESALKLIDNPATKATYLYMAFDALSTAASQVGMVEKSRELCYKAIEAVDRINTNEQLGFYMVMYSNLLTTLSHTSRTVEYRDVKSKLLDILQNKRDVDIVRLALRSTLLDVAVADMRMLGFTRERAENYIRSITELVESDAAGKKVFYYPDEDLFIYRRMIREGMLDECARCCKLILDRRDVFCGDIAKFYQLVETLSKKDESLFTEEELDRYNKAYFKLLKDSVESNRLLSGQLVREEFRIYEIDTAYDSLRAKYETDSLTVCYNRPSFEMNAAKFLGENTNGSIVFIDMDGLKYTNDHFGHSAGDFLLKTFVSVVNGAIDKNSERLYRYAGDEFILVTAKDREETEELISEIYDRLDQPHVFNDDRIIINFSYGIASFEEGCGEQNIDPTDEKSLTAAVESAVKIADTRMYECKRRHKEQDPEHVRM